jgi:hypothetical protein
MADLPLSTNILTLAIMVAKRPDVGRGAQPQREFLSRKTK